jgi:hypothetical protein
VDGGCFESLSAMVIVMPPPLLDSQVLIIMSSTIYECTFVPMKILYITKYKGENMLLYGMGR